MEEDILKYLQTVMFRGTPCNLLGEKNKTEQRNSNVNKLKSLI